MLRSMRGAAGTWIVKILFVLLIISFGAWGVADYVTGGADPTVAEVGDAEITTSQLRQAYDRAIADARQRFGLSVDRDQAVMLGLDRQALDQLIDQAALAQAIEALDLTASNAMVVAAIRNAPAFRGLTGEFDAARFQSTLFSLGLAEADYAALVARDLAAAALRAAAAAATLTPQALVDATTARQAARRTAAGVAFDAAALPPPPEPDAAALQARFKQDAALYTSPERRSARYVHIDPTVIAADLNFDEDRLRTVYDTRILQLTTPAIRELRQAVFADAATAATFAARARDAGGLDAARGDGDPSVVDLGRLEIDDAPAPLADVAFDPAVVAGAIVGPVSSPLGWHVAEVVSAENEIRPSFEAAREDVRALLAEDDAFAAVAAVAAAVDDSLGGGLSIAEAAAAAGLEALTIAGLDRDGLQADASPFNAPGGEVFLATLFETPEGETSLLVDTDQGGFFALEVIGVDAPAPSPFEAVRDDIAAALMAEAAAAAATAAAAAAANDLRAGRAAADIAAETDGASVFRVGAFGLSGRLDDGRRVGLPGAAVADAFAAAPGDVIVAPTVSGAAALRIEAAPDAAVDADAIRAQLDGGRGAALDSALIRAMRDLVGAEIDEQAAMRALDPDSGL